MGGARRRKCGALPGLLDGRRAPSGRRGGRLTASESSHHRGSSVRVPPDASIGAIRNGAESAPVGWGGARQVGEGRPPGGERRSQGAALRPVRRLAGPRRGTHGRNGTYDAAVPSGGGAPEAGGRGSATGRHGLRRTSVADRSGGLATPRRAPGAALTRRREDGLSAVKLWLTKRAIRWRNPDRSGTAPAPGQPIAAAPRLGTPPGRARCSVRGRGNDRATVTTAVRVNGNGVLRPGELGQRVRRCCVPRGSRFHQIS